MTRKALGRGLDALIPRPPADRAVVDRPQEDRSDREGEVGAVPNRGMIPVDRIRPNPWQPRKTSDPVRMDELVRSIQAKGVLEPVLVRRLQDGAFELVAGERRLRAAQRAGFKEVPSIIVELNDNETLEVALIENLQREDLNPVDEARAYQLLADEFGHTHDQIAERVGKDRSTVTNLLRLLRLPDEVLTLLAEGRLATGHARALLALGRSEEQHIWAARIVEEAWSVREVERRLGGPAASTEQKSHAKNKIQGPRDPHIARVEEAIRRRTGTDVRVRLGRKGGGRIELVCADREDMERILQILGVEVH